MHQRERRNHEIIFSKGEIHEDRKLANEVAQKAYDKLLTNTSILAVSSRIAFFHSVLFCLSCLPTDTHLLILSELRLYGSITFTRDVESL